MAQAWAEIIQTWEYLLRSCGVPISVPLYRIANGASAAASELMRGKALPLLFIARFIMFCYSVLTVNVMSQKTSQLIQPLPRCQAPILLVLFLKMQIM